MKSVIQEEKECFLCGTTYNLHDHHIFFGTANRKQSEKYGMKVWLCIYHHTGSNEAVHHNISLDLFIKKVAQRRFEELYSHEEFMRVFGKNYL